MADLTYWRRQYSRRAALAAGGAMAFSLACSSSSNNNGGSKPAATTGGGASSAPTTGAATPARASTPAAVIASAVAVPQASSIKTTPIPTGAKTGGVRVYGNQDPGITLDPHTTESPMSHQSQGRIYNMLLRRLEDTPGDPYLVEDLATTVEQPDQQTFTFKLAPNIKWQNVAPVSGRAFTSDDVKYNFARIVTNSPDFRMRTMFDMIDSVQTPDPNTAVFKMKFPYAPFLVNVAFEWVMMVPRELADANKLDTQGIGTGPFQLSGDWSGTKDTEVTLKKNPTYFRQGLPFLDTVKIQVIPDPATQFAKALAGEIDNASFTITSGPNVLKQQQDQYKAKFPNATIYQTPPYGVWYKFYFNQQRDTPFSKDKRVRQAAAAAVNYQQIAGLFSNIGEQGQPMAPGNKAWKLEDPSALPKYDMQKAQQLMSAAGFPDGFKIQDSVSANYGGTIVAPIVKQFLSAIKIDLTIDVRENAAWIASTYRGTDYEMSSHADASWDDPDKNLYDRFHSKGGTNNTHTNDPKLDAMLEAQRREFDYTKRKALVDDISRYLLDLTPEVWMFSSGSVQSVAPWVKNYRAMASGWQSFHYDDLLWYDGAPNRS